MKYKSRPEYITAVQWKGDNRAEVEAMLGIKAHNIRHNGELNVWPVKAPIGHYIIKAEPLECLTPQEFGKRYLETK